MKGARHGQNARACAGLALIAGLSACPAPQVDAGPPPTTRLAIRLPAPQDTDPRPQATGVHAPRVDVVVDLPPGQWLAAPQLVLPDLVGKAEVSIDGQPPLHIAGGVGPSVLSLEALSPGRHRIVLTALPDPSLPAVLLGNEGASSPTLLSAPVLMLQPAAHVAALAVPVGQDASVAPIARVEGAPPGARVRFVATDRGQILAELGTAAVVAGVAQAAPTAWAFPRWRPAAPALTTVFAVLLAADGEVLDARALRSGMSHVSLGDRALLVDGDVVRPVAIRGSPRLPLGHMLSNLKRTGASSLEFHGAVPTTDQLSDLDELGIPAIVLPRCAGALGRHLDRDQQGASAVEHQAAVRAQNEQLAWRLAAHASVLLLVTEAHQVPGLAELLARADPLDRPVVGHDLPLATVIAGGNGGKHGHDKGAFIVESAWSGGRGDSALLAGAFAAALDQGARGGVLEHVSEPEQAAAWQAALAGAGVAPLDLPERRASARLELEGAQPGEVVWLEADWLDAEASVVDAEGRAVMRAWHEGGAQLHAGAQRVDLVVAPARWGAGGVPPPAQTVALGQGSGGPAGGGGAGGSGTTPR